MGKEYLGRGPCSSLSRGMRRVSLLPLDLGRGYDAPFLVRPDRLPLGKATVCKGHRKPNREGFACAASSVPVSKFWVRIANTSGFEFPALLFVPKMNLSSAGNAEGNTFPTFYGFDHEF